MVSDAMPICSVRVVVKDFQDDKKQSNKENLVANGNEHIPRFNMFLENAVSLSKSTQIDDTIPCKHDIKNVEDEKDIKKYAGIEDAVILKVFPIVFDLNHLPLMRK